MDNSKIKNLSLDLSTDYPRSPREMLGGYVVAARALDKCRATINGTAGDYHFDCPLDKLFFGFTGISVAGFKSYVATGATDAEVADWIVANARSRPLSEVIQWNNDLRGRRIADMPAELQEFLEGYIPEFIPKNRPVYVWFDVYDIEEKRI